MVLHFHSSEGRRRQKLHQLQV